MLRTSMLATRRFMLVFVLTFICIPSFTAFSEKEKGVYILYQSGLVLGSWSHHESSKFKTICLKTSPNFLNLTKVCLRSRLELKWLNVLSIYVRGFKPAFFSNHLNLFIGCIKKIVFGKPIPRFGNAIGTNCLN